MNSIATVQLWDYIVGYIAWDNQRNLGVFEYEPDFLKRGLDIAPICMSIASARLIPYIFPQLEPKVFAGLPGLLSDSLPDLFGNKVIDQWQKYSEISPKSLNPVERLCFMGKSGMGALEFKPIISTNTPIVEKLKLDELAAIAQQISGNQDILFAKAEEPDALHQIFQIGASAGGRRPKVIIGLNDITGEICSGQNIIPTNFEHWLLKLESDKEYPHGRVEYAYALMAKDVGIKMADVKLIERNNTAYFLTKRFDRIGNTKLHVQTLCGMAHYSYLDSGIYGYDDVFIVFRKLNLAYPDFEQLFRLMCFNVLARNYDDHTKNMSFIMDKYGTWTFAPAYDLTFCHLPNEPSWYHKHEMHVNGKTFNINIADLVEVGLKNDIKKVKAIIQQCKDVISNWLYYAKTAGISQNISELIYKEITKII